MWFTRSGPSVSADSKVTGEVTTAICAEQVQTLYAGMPIALLVNGVLGLILAVVQWQVVPKNSILLWLAILAFMSGVRFILFLCYRRKPASMSTAAWMRWFRSSITTMGMTWGLASVMLFPEHDVPRQAFLAFTLAGLTAGAIIALSIDRIAVLLFTGPALGALVMRLYSVHDEIQLAMSAMTALFLLYIIMIAQRTHRTLLDNVNLRIADNDHLQALHANEARLREAQRVARVGSFDWNPVSDELMWSDEHFRLWGLEPQSVTPDYAVFRRAIHPEDVERVETLTQQALQGGRTYVCVHRVIWPDGTVRSIQGRGEVEFDSAGKPIRMYGTVLDVTEQQQAKRSVQEFKNTLDQTLDCVFMFDASTLRFIYVNQGAMQQVGFSFDELLQLHPYDIKPDLDEPQLREIIAPLLRGEKDSLNFETVHQHKNGTRVPVEIFLQYIASQGDKPRFVAIVRDITERKKAEAELRIAAIAFESKEGIIVTDADQAILKVNHAFTRITGYSAAEAIGDTPGRLLRSGRHDSEFYKLMWESLLQEKFWQGELWNRRKNGEVYPEWLSISVLTNENGEVTHYIAMFSDITEKKQAEETIYNLAFYDPLTSLPNRRLLHDRIQHTLASSARHQRHGAVLFIDLDNFKALNDTRGHDVGDLLLIEVATRLKTCVRTDDTVARQGGDEFVVVLSDLSVDAGQAAIQAELIANKIRTALIQPFMLNGNEYHGSPSIGINLFLANEFSVDELLKRADTAMYQAKRSGRNTIRFFDPATHAAMEVRISLETDLRHAIPGNQLQLYYQMQVDHQGAIFGAEVLLRWDHPGKGLVPPLQFISLAEETGLILPIGHWVLETACKQLQEWEKDPRTQHLQLAVNVSARQFRQSDFVTQVSNVLEKTGIDPKKLKLELTESLVLDNINQTIAKMQALKSMGVCFSMDDFGTGYSSLAYLTLLPLDQVKIDQSFVRNLGNKPGNAVIVQTIIGMTKNLGLNVIAEGVETAAQREFLEKHGCYHYQGYLFGKPVPLSVFEASLFQDDNGRVLSNQKKA